MGRTNDEECVCECDCEKAADVVVPGESREPIDITTEEGAKAYIEEEKNDFIARYKRRAEEKLREELGEKARLEAIKELGITEEEYDSVFGFSRRHREEGIVTGIQLDESEEEDYVEKIEAIRKEQDVILNLMLNKEMHIELDKNNKRNAFVTEYQDLEKLKLSYLDILSSSYLKSDGAAVVVNDRGKRFSALEK